MLIWILFVVGFVLLIKGADWLVDGSISLAKKWNVSNIVVGLTIVSFGTSMPELVVNLLSSMNGNTELAIGNIFGSNIANVLLILGASALFRALPIQRNTIFSEIPFAIAAALLVGYLANASLFDPSQRLIISRYDGLFLLFFFLLFMIYVKRLSEINESDSNEEYTQHSMWKSWLFVGLGSIALFLGGKWIVDGALEIAQIMGFSEGFIGLSIVALGTSLPELMASVTAARKNNAEIAVGNVVGSNIFNLLWILGLTSVITPLPFDVLSNNDILVMILSATLVIVVLPFGGGKVISRPAGALFLICYFVYLYILYQRG